MLFNTAIRAIGLLPCILCYAVVRKLRVAKDILNEEHF